jgi:hypothetical protein
VRKLLSSVLIALFLLSVQTLQASAAEADASNIANANSPQQIDQASARHPNHQKQWQRKHSHYCDMHKNLTEIDTNKDGMISKEEFMTFHENMFNDMPQTNGMVSAKQLEVYIHRGKHHKSRPKTPESEDTNIHHPADNKTR